MCVHHEIKAILNKIKILLNKILSHRDGKICVLKFKSSKKCHEDI